MFVKLHWFQDLLRFIGKEKFLANYLISKSKQVAKKLLDGKVYFFCKVY